MGHTSRKYASMNMYRGWRILERRPGSANWVAVRDLITSDKSLFNQVSAPTEKALKKRIDAELRVCDNCPHPLHLHADKWEGCHATGCPCELSH